METQVTTWADINYLGITGNMIVIIILLKCFVMVWKMPKENYINVGRSIVTMFAGIGVWFICLKVYFGG